MDFNCLEDSSLNGAVRILVVRWAVASLDADASNHLLRYHVKFANTLRPDSPPWFEDPHTKISLEVFSHRLLRTSLICSKVQCKKGARQDVFRSGGLDASNGSDRAETRAAEGLIRTVPIHGNACFEMDVRRCHAHAVFEHTCI